MNKNELIRKFTKIEKRENKTEILVCLVEWENSYEPVLQWKVVQTLKKNSSKLEIDTQVNEILNDKRYFSFCIECEAFKQAGRIMMLQDKSLCHSCAERNHSVRF
jgi:hypothetical protein